MAEAYLLVGRLDDLHAHDGEIPGLVGPDGKPQIVRVDNGEAVAAVSGVDGDRAEPLDFDKCVELVGEADMVADADRNDLAVAALRARLDQPARRLDHEPRLRLLHRDDTRLQEHGRDADRVGAGHRRRVLRLHHDPADVSGRVLGRNQQVDVTKYAPTRLLQDEVAQGLVARDEARLFPDGLARRWRHAADDDVADFPLGVAADDVNDATRSHRRPQAMLSTGSPRTAKSGVMPRPGESGAVMKPLTRFGAPAAIVTVP